MSLKIKHQQIVFKYKHEFSINKEAPTNYHKYQLSKNSFLIYLLNLLIMLSIEFSP